MKKSIITISAVAVLVSGAAFAGPFGGMFGPPSVDERVERMTNNLGLSDTQATEIRNILEEQAEVRKAHKEAVRTKLSSVLTEDQMEAIGSYRKGKGGKGCDKPFKRARYEGRFW